MKTAPYLVCATLLATLGMNSAFAKPITVKLTGHVTGWGDDNDAYLGGQVTLGQAATVTYSYDPGTPDVDPSPSTGHYQPTPAQGASLRVTTGFLTFESDSTSHLDAYVFPGSPEGGGSFWFQSFPNKPLANGTSVDSISLSFSSENGTAPPSDALPADAPDVHAFAYRQIRVQGAPWGRMMVVVDIDSAELVPPAIEISPSAGSFLSQQRFDAAVLLPVGTQVSSMQASVNGSPVALSYPGSCQSVAPNSLGRPAILCPDARTVLSSMTGDTRVDWQVTLTDGTVYTDYVRWNLMP